jgi:hypothetical protein
MLSSLRRSLLWLENGIIFQDILQSNTLFHEYLHIEVALDDKAAKVSLLQRFFEYILFNCIHTDQPVNVHCLGLSDSMTSILGLLIHRRVPIRVIENHTVCTCEIETDTTATCGRDKAEDFLIEVELINLSLAHFDFNRTVKAHIGVAMKVQKVFKNV